MGYLNDYIIRKIKWIEKVLTLCQWIIVHELSFALCLKHTCKIDLSERLLKSEFLLQFQAKTCKVTAPIYHNFILFC